MALDMNSKSSSELIELIEAEMKELRQIETLETQIREMAAVKRDRVMSLWKTAIAANPRPVKQGFLVQEAIAAPPKPESVEAAAPIEKSTPTVAAAPRPYGTPGAPRDLLAESGVSPKVPSGNGASALVNADAAKRAPSAHQVFQSLNRLVGGNKNEPLKN